MKLVFIFLFSMLLLSGCGTIVNLIVPPYVPITIKVYNQDAYNADNTMCSDAGKNFVPTFSGGAVVTSTVDGATADTSLIPLSPLVPLYGAAGGAASALSDGFDIMSNQHNNVYRHCLSDQLNIDHAAIIAKPEK